MNKYNLSTIKLSHVMCISFNINISLTCPVKTINWSVNFNKNVAKKCWYAVRPVVPGTYANKKHYIVYNKLSEKFGRCLHGLTVHLNFLPEKYKGGFLLTPSNITMCLLQIFFYLSPLRRCNSKKLWNVSHA